MKKRDLNLLETRMRTKTSDFRDAEKFEGDTVVHPPHLRGQNHPLELSTLRDSLNSNRRWAFFDEFLEAQLPFLFCSSKKTFDTYRVWTLALSTAAPRLLAEKAD